MYSSSDDDSGHRRSAGAVRKHRKKGSKEQRRQAAAAAAAQQEIIRQLASLQLPHMHSNFGHSASLQQNQQQQPSTDRPSTEATTRRQQQQQQQSPAAQSYASPPGGATEPPTIRILVVSDIDLASASALAETALTSEELHRVDLCIACGPFCREEDLKPYYQGRQRRRHMARYSHNHHHASSSSSSSQQHGNLSSSFRGGGVSSSASPYMNTTKRDRMAMIPPMPQTNYGAHHQSGSSSNNSMTHQYPFRRTREETAALEGLMTAALSQLESIVCRVIFVPGRTDPMTTIHSAGPNSSCIRYTKERRLTPNSRNIHQHWMPICPGLGCAGLLYLDWQRLQQHPPPLEDGEMEDDDDDDDDEEDSDSELPEDSSFSYNGGDDPYNANHGTFTAARGIPEEHDDDDEDEVAPEDDDDDEEDDDDDESNEPLTEAERTERYGTEFVNHLERLIHLAPPTAAVTETPVAAQTHASIAGLLRTKLFQSILVTHFHHAEKDDDDDDDEFMDADTGADYASGPFYGNNNNNNNYHGHGYHQQQQQYMGQYHPHYNAPTSARGMRNNVNHQYGASSSTMGPPSFGSHKTMNDAGIHSPHAAAKTAVVTAEDDDEEEESFDPPWPNEHEAFCALPAVQEHVLLEIAAGRNSMGNTVRPMEMPKGNVHVVLPGSLRERGEFCLIDVAFMKSTTNHSHYKGTAAPSSVSVGAASSGIGGVRRDSDSSSSKTSNNPHKDDYRWRVRRTRFHTLNDYV